MAKKRPKATKSALKTTSGGGLGSAMIKAAQSILPGRTSQAEARKWLKGKKKKKSAQWYAKEIARLRLKKRYERIKLRV